MCTADDDDSSPAPTSYAESFQFYLSSNTVVGLNRVWSSSPFRIQRIAWFLIVTIGSIVTACHAYAMVAQYIAYETKTQTSILSNETLEFPAVSVCNLNTMRWSPDLECDGYRRERTMTFNVFTTESNRRMIDEVLGADWHVEARKSGQTPTEFLSRRMNEKTKGDYIQSACATRPVFTQDEIRQMWTVFDEDLTEFNAFAVSARSEVKKYLEGDRALLQDPLIEADSMLQTAAVGDRDTNNMPQQVQEMQKFVLNCMMGREACEKVPAAKPTLFQDLKFGLCYTFGGQTDYVLYDYYVPKNAPKSTRRLKVMINWQRNGEDYTRTKSHLTHSLHKQ